ncbi:MAG: hypothetical protein K8T10_18445 [Candidatus Eremiobacteraeota bacterium]|nr:hypothetical protein [Candidatus Eremiobacteraeota bacterium]
MKQHKFLIPGLLLLVVFLFTSCSNPKRHYDAGEALEGADKRLLANREYMRALKGTNDRKKKAELQKRIANNCRIGKQYQEAITYYKQSIENYNMFGMNAPYQRLAECYISIGNTGAAAALTKDLGGKKPKDYMVHQAEISKAIGAHYELKKDFNEASYYYEQYMKYAVQLKNGKMLRDAKIRLDDVKVKLNK